MPPSRWYYDPGTIPGEAFAYLDVPHDALQYASAIIVEDDTGNPDNQAYRAILGQPDDPSERRPDQISPSFPSLYDAEQWAETRILPPHAKIPIDIHLEDSIQDSYQPGPNEILIAITEPGRRPISPRGIFAATYHLTAWDIPHTIHHPTIGIMQPLSVKDVDPLLDFVLKHRNTMSKLIVYCKGGSVRSPGVAIALSEWLPTHPRTSDLIIKQPCFHRPIYRTLCLAATERGLLLP